MRLPLLLFVTLAMPLAAADWPRFRGVNGGSVGESGALPDKLDPDANAIWAVDLPMGKSSPTLAAERIFITAHEGEDLLTIALDRETGEERWRRAIRRDRVEEMNRLNDEAAATAVTDGERVFVFFAGYGMAAYSVDGEELWKVRMGPFTNFHGMGASPVYADGKVIMVCDQDRDAYIVAFNAADGSVAWRVDRTDVVHSYPTPVVYRPAGAPAEVIVAGSYQIVSYGVADGAELWRFGGIAYQVKGSPVIDGETLYINAWSVGGEPAARLELPPFEETVAMHDEDGDGLIDKSELPRSWVPGNWPMQDLDKDDHLGPRDWKYYRQRRVSTNGTLGIRLGGRGDVTESHLLWRTQRNMPDVPGALFYQGAVYLIKNGGILTTLNAEDGAVFKEGRVREAIDNYYSSPAAGDGKVYLVSETGIVTVLRAGPQWEIISTTNLDDGAYATPALVDGRVYLRTDSRLYCFGD